MIKGDYKERGNRMEGKRENSCLICVKSFVELVPVVGISSCPYATLEFSETKYGIFSKRESSIFGDTLFLNITLCCFLKLKMET